MYCPNGKVADTKVKDHIKTVLIKRKQKHKTTLAPRLKFDVRLFTTSHRLMIDAFFQNHGGKCCPGMCTVQLRRNDTRRSKHFYKNGAPCRGIFIGLARTIYIRCIYGIFGREIIKYTVYRYGFWPTLHI